MKKDFKRVLEIFADIIMNPEFRQEKIDLAKNQTKEGIRRRWDQPNRAAGELFNEKVYGANTAYGNRTTIKTINNITRDDLIAFHSKYFAPNNLYLLIVGDISLSEAKAQLENAFRGWSKKEVKLPEVAPLVEKSDGTIYYAYKETPQANIYLGHLGVKRNNPDQYKIELMNTILGGGFTARLMKELRSNRGLTYGIRGGVNSGKDKGLFQISSQLKAEKCVEALTLIKEIIKEMQEKPVTDQEIEQAKNYINNSFVFRFEQKDRYLAQYVNQKLSGYPDDYFEKYLDNIKKITKKDIQEAAKKYMNPEKMTIVIVGDEKRFDKPLSTFGKVVPLDFKQILKDEMAGNK
jgi:predicted Zn-dependent peptidase